TVAPDTVNARQQVTDDVMAQLVPTRKYTPAAAETQAKIWGAAMDRLGAMSGTDAFSLYQRDMGGNAAGTNAAEPSMTMDQPAYHGTPHNVDRFSLQKIGTGEGAQVYGWGLYFASQREVADFYRRNLTGIARSIPATMGDQALQEAGGDRGRAVATL